VVIITRPPTRHHWIGKEQSWASRNHHYSRHEQLLDRTYEGKGSVTEAARCRLQSNERGLGIYYVELGFVSVSAMESRLGDTLIADVHGQINFREINKSSPFINSACLGPVTQDATGIMIQADRAAFKLPLVMIL